MTNNQIADVLEIWGNKNVLQKDVENTIKKNMRETWEL